MKFWPVIAYLFMCNFVFAQDTESGKISSYPFSGNANDNSGINHGVVFGAASTTDRFGNPNQAYYFDGSDDYIQIPHSSTLNFSFNQEFTISVWVNPANTQNLSGTGNEVISKWNATTSESYPYAVRFLNESQVAGNGSKVMFLRYESQVCGLESYTISHCPIPREEWTHIVLLKKDNRLYIYINGVLSSEASDTSAGICGTENNLPILIGLRQNTSYFFRGKIDDIIFYNRALSAPDIEALFSINDWSAPPNPPVNILSFTVQDQTEEAVINANAKTITVEVRCDADLTNLAPSFTLSPNTLARVNEVQQTSGVSINDFTQPVVYSIESAAGCIQQLWSISIIKKSEHHDTDILSFTITGQTKEAVINAASKTISIEAPCYADLSNLAPSFTLSPNTIAQVNGVSQTSGVTQNDFTQPVIYSITSTLGCNEQLWSITIIKKTEQDDGLTNFVDFYLAEQLEPGVIDLENNTITVEVSCITDLSALISSFILPSGTVAQINAIPQLSGTTVNNFSSPVFYTLSNSEECTTASWVVYASKRTYTIDDINNNYNDNNFFIPNIITPNSDGKNDYFVIGSFFYGSTLRIYNRYGKQVYLNHSYRNQFNGDNLSSGIYFITLNSECFAELIKATLHIIK
jgi:gliding motility-associated-like protein